MQVEKTLAEVKQRVENLHTKLDSANSKLDSFADRVGQPLLDSQLTGAIYALLLLGAIIFGAKAF